MEFTIAHMFTIYTAATLAILINLIASLAAPAPVVTPRAVRRLRSSKRLRRIPNQLKAQAVKRATAKRQAVKRATVKRHTIRRALRQADRSLGALAAKRQAVKRATNDATHSNHIIDNQIAHMFA